MQEDKKQQRVPPPNATVQRMMKAPSHPHTRPLRNWPLNRQATVTKLGRTGKSGMRMVVTKRIGSTKNAGKMIGMRMQKMRSSGPRSSGRIGRRSKGAGTLNSSGVNGKQKKNAPDVKADKAKGEAGNTSRVDTKERARADRRMRRKRRSSLKSSATHGRNHALRPD